MIRRDEARESSTKDITTHLWMQEEEASVGKRRVRVVVVVVVIGFKHDKR